MGTEIERKFVIAPGRAVPAAPGAAIRQGYLCVGADGAEVRLRQQGDRYTLTAKRGSGLVRQEWETHLTGRQFEEMWPASEGARLEKVRHSVPIADGVALVDVYEGALTGLRVVEIEFQDTAHAADFQPPDWFGPEVTGRPEYKNQNLIGITAAEAAALIRGGSAT